MEIDDKKPKLDGADLAKFFVTARQEGWLWGTFKNNRKYYMGCVKYVDATYDARDGRVFSLTLRGLLQNTTFQETNEWRKSDCIERALKFLKTLHEQGHEIAYAELKTAQAEADRKEMEMLKQKGLDVNG